MLKGEGRREKGEGRREKGEGRREKGEGRRGFRGEGARNLILTEFSRLPNTDEIGLGRLETRKSMLKVKEQQRIEEENEY